MPSRDTRLARTVRRIIEREHAKEEAARKQPRYARLTFIWKVLFWVVGLPAVFVGVVQFLPRVDVTNSDPVDAANPFSSEFTITNTGYVPLNSVSADVAMGYFLTGTRHHDPSFHPNYRSRIRRPDPAWMNHHLGLGDKFSITPNDLFQMTPGVRLSEVDFAVVVTYKWFMWPFQREKVFPFSAHKQSNGQFYWYHHAVD